MSLCNRFLGAVALACAIVALPFLFSGTAEAQARVPYRVQLSKTCNFVVCTLTFPVVAAKRRVELSNITCLSQANTAIFNIYVYTTPAPVVFHYLSPEWARSRNGQATINYSDATGIFATTGQRFVAEFQATGTTSASFLTCALYGEVVVLP